MKTPRGRFRSQVAIDMPAGSNAAGTTGLEIFPDPFDFPGADPIIQIDNGGVNFLYAHGQGVFQYSETNNTGSVTFGPDQGIGIFVSAPNAAALSLYWAPGVTPDLLFGALLECRGYNSTKFDVRITSSGNFVVGKNSPPADGELFSSDCAFWFDDTNGAAKLKIKAKQANGTVRTGEVALA